MSILATSLKYRAQTPESHHSQITPSNADLIQRCENGDQRAWGELVHRYAWLVYSVPCRAGLNETDAEDVMQNVFRILFQKLPTLRDPSRLGAWLVTCARNETINQLRRSHPTSTLADELVASNNNLHGIEEQDLLRKAIGRLNGSEKIIVVALLENPEISDAELAAKTGLKQDSVRAVRGRALRKLKETLSQMGWRV